MNRVAARSRGPFARLAPLALVAMTSLAGLSLMTGCYKSDYEAAKAGKEEAEKKVKDLEGQIAQVQNTAKAQIAEAQAQAQRMSTGNLVTLVNGEAIGTDGVRFANGQFVRHGERVRATKGVVNSRVIFQDGRLADQTLTLVRDNGKRNLVGAIRNSRPDGEWVWFDADDKPYKRENWKDGRLETVEDVSVAKDGKLTGRRVAAADRTAWIRATAPVFVNLPELIRDTSIPPAPVPEAKPPAGGTSGAKPTTPSGTNRPGTSGTPGTTPRRGN